MATEDGGIDELVRSIGIRHVYLHAGIEIESALTERAAHELGLIFRDELQRIVFRGLKGTGKRQAYLRQMIDGERDPYSIIDEVMDEYLAVRPRDRE